MIEVKNISFSWGRKPILDDVSFTVSPNEITVLAGANGAGKTTLMKVIAGLSLPSSGTILADGFDIFTYPIRFRKALGYLPEASPVDPELTIKAYLKFRAKLKGEQSRKIRHRIQEAVELCGLEELIDTRISNLSLGQRKRVALADAILLRPRFLVLDDLFSGLDVATRASITGILSSVSSFSSVLVSGHELDEFAKFAKKFLVLSRSHISEFKTAAEVQKVLQDGTVEPDA